jgi:hypothetical protein
MVRLLRSHDLFALLCSVGGVAVLCSDRGEPPLLRLGFLLSGAPDRFVALFLGKRFVRGQASVVVAQPLKVVHALCGEVFGLGARLVGSGELGLQVDDLLAQRGHGLGVLDFVFTVGQGVDLLRAALVVLGHCVFGHACNGRDHRAHNDGEPRSRSDSRYVSHASPHPRWNLE